MKLPARGAALLVLAAGAVAAACGDGAGASAGGAARPDDGRAPPGALLRLATTTSVSDSGLLGALLPEFERETGLRVTVTAVGTGAAFRLARDGNADVLLVHDRQGEDEFIASGDGTSRVDLMWNTFEILGPGADPAGVASAPTGSEALRRIADAEAPFISRGDDSGTHRRERALFAAAGIADPAWGGHASTGQGMGHTLSVANELGAYVLCDQGTRLGWKGELRLVPLAAGLDDLKNRYAFVRIAKARHPESDVAGAETLIAWFLSPETTRRIEEFRAGGRPLFHPVHHAAGAGR